MGPIERYAGARYACLNGYIYLGYTYVGEDGDEVEAYEAIPCRRCLEDGVDDDQR